MRIAPKWLAAGAVLALMAACSCGKSPGNPAGGCQTDKDCKTGQKCSSGQCKTASCNTTLDCPAGSVCEGGVCAAPHDGGTGQPDGGQSGPDGGPSLAATPGTLDFGAARIGDKISVDLTLQNVGTSSLTISDVRLGDATSPEFTFTTSKPVPAAVAPNDKNPLLVHVTYQPVDNKPDLDGNVTVTSNDPQSPVTKVPITMSFKGLSEIAILGDLDPTKPDVRSADLGATPTGGAAVKSFYVANVGTVNAPLTVSQIYVEPAGGAFTVTPTMGQGDPPRFLSPLRICNKDKPLCTAQETCSKANDPQPAMGVCLDSSGKPADAIPLSIRFSPTAAGAQTATLKIENDEQNGGNDLNENPLDTVALTGTGTEAKLQIAPSPVDFGDVYVNTSATKTVTITNTGSGTLTVSALSLAASPSPFTLTAPGLPITLTAGANATATLGFAPLAVGAAADNLVVTSDDPTSPSIQVPVLANAVVPPRIEAAPPPPYDFGEVQLGQTKAVAVTVKNTGGQALLVNQVTWAPFSSHDFTASAPPASVPPSGSFTLTLTFAPPVANGVGQRGGAFLVYCNDPSLPVDLSGNHYLQLDYQGNAVDPKLTVSPSSHAFGGIYRQASAPPAGATPAIFTISNSGTGTLTVTNVQITNDPAGAFAVALQTGVVLPKTLAAGASFDATVGFIPPTLGSFSGSLQVDSDDVDKPAGETKALTGDGVGCPTNYWDADGDPNNGCEYGPCVVSNGGVEACDGIDNDCNGIVDDPAPVAAACNGKFPNADGHCQGGGTPSAVCVMDACHPTWWNLNGLTPDGCEYSCTGNVGNPDPPDDGFVDANCDGIDGDVAKAIFVSNDAGASDSNPGSPSLPKQTLGAAIGAAAAAGKYVIVDKGVGAYGNGTTTLALANGVSIFGGYSWKAVSVTAPLGWARADGQEATWLGATTGVLASSLASATTLDRLVIYSASATASGGSSIGLFANGAANLFLHKVHIVAGDGANGANGSGGTRGADGNQGGTGTAGCENSSFLCNSCSQPQGGPGGTSPCGRTGGAGGSAGQGGGWGNGGAPGAGGTSGGGGAPNHNWCWRGSGCGTCAGNDQNPAPITYWGGDGAAGSTGTDGVAGASIGAFSAGGYVPAAGGDGLNGGDGNGGGGGGGGGGGTDGCDSYGSGGGGGGAGACHGTFATRGQGAGGSFGVVAWASKLTVDLSAIDVGRGGTGGIGGTGGGGGNGGGRGLPGPWSGCSNQDDGSNGAMGGLGGNGGRGGHGGGGGGGPSIGIVWTGGSTLSATGNGVTHAGAGPGGFSPGNSGQWGLLQDLWP